MYSVNEKSITADYRKYKSRAREFCAANKLERALECIKFCSFLAYSFPIINSFCDDELENLLEDIAERIIVKKANNISTSPKRFIFYDSLTIDNSGLTQQYLRFLISKNYELLFVIPDPAQLNKASDIINEIKAYDNARLYICTEKLLSEKIGSIHKVIEDYGADSAFLHMAPNDVVGVSVFSKCKNIRKYFINLTDHAFWLGKSCGDIFLEFRKAGYAISAEKRKIASEKLRINYYYPIQKTTKFLGFDFEISGKVVGFAGGSLYKILADKNELFLSIVRDLLKKHNNFLFILAGWGNSSKLKDFIRNNNLEKRLFYIGKRKDLDQVFKHIDIYFNTYPFMGGLMTHYALNNNKAIIGLVDKELRSLNSLESFLDLKNYSTPSTPEEFITEASRLIDDANYRCENADIFNGKKISKHDFNDCLSSILEDKYFSQENDHNLELSHIKYLQLYIDYENYIEKAYYYKKIRMLGKCMSLKEIIFAMLATAIWNNKKLLNTFVNLYKNKL